jgi:hypothetical protein
MKTLASPEKIRKLELPEKLAGNGILLAKRNYNQG